MGGLKELYIIPFNDVSSYAEASGVVTGITKVSTKRFYKFQQLAQTAQAIETIQGSDENGTVFYEQSVELFLNKMQASVRNMVKVLAASRCIVITADRNGKYFMYGATLGLTAAEGEGNSGKANGDRNGYGLFLRGAEPEPCFEVSSSLISSLETPA